MEKHYTRTKILGVVITEVYIGGYCRRPGFNPWEDPLEKGMATYSSILAWRIPQIEELGGLQSVSCKELGRTEQLTLSQ